VRACSARAARPHTQLAVPLSRHQESHCIGEDGRSGQGRQSIAITGAPSALRTQARPALPLRLPQELAIGSRTSGSGHQVAEPREPQCRADRDRSQRTGTRGTDENLTRTRGWALPTAVGRGRASPLPAGVDLFQPLRRANHVGDGLRKLLVGHGGVYAFEAGGQRRAQLLGACEHTVT